MREDNVRPNKGHRKFFMYGDRELWSSDSEDGDYVLTADVKRPTRRTKRKRSSEESGILKCNNLAEYDDPWGQRMPAEILCKIFQHVIGLEGNSSSLDSISKVCRLWQSVTLIPALWLKVKLSCMNQKKDNVIENFFKWKMPNLTSIEISGIPKPSAWKVIEDNCPKLRSIALSNSSISGPALLSIAQQCPFLNSVRLCDVVSSATSSLAMIKLFEAMNARLRSFSLSNRSGSFTKPLEVALKHCPNMERFELNGITRNSVITLNIAELQKSWRKLRVLRFIDIIMKCSIQGDCSLGFPELTELCLSDFTGRGCQNSDIVCSLFRMSHKLNNLYLGKISNLSYLSPTQLPACILEYLYLDKIAGCHLLIGSMLKKWKNSLVEFHASLSDDVFRGMVANFDQLKPFPALRELYVCGMPVTPSDVLLVVNACPKLVKLDLTQCRELPRGTKKLYDDKQSIIKLISTLKEMPGCND